MSTTKAPGKAMVDILAAFAFACVVLSGTDAALTPGRLADHSLTVTGSNGEVTISASRWDREAQGQLRTMLLPGIAETFVTDHQLEDGLELDFERTFDRTTGSWSVSVTLPPGHSHPALVQLWCRNCASAAGPEEATALLASKALDGGSGTLVLLLEHAALQTGTTTATASARRLLAASTSAGDGSCVLQLGDGAAPQTFVACTQVKGVGDNFFLMWTAEPVPSNASKVMLTVGMNATTAGYVAIGFPTRPGRMVGATAMILQACAAGSAGCTAGAKLGQWYLGGEQESDVNPSNGLAASNAQAAGLATSGQLAGTFQLEVDAPTAAAGRRRQLLLLENADGSMPLIFAAGNLNSDGSLQQHYSDASGSLQMATATRSADNSSATAQGAAPAPESATSMDGAVLMEGDGGGGGEDDTLKSAHAWLAAIGWGVLIPMGIVIARCFKEADPIWFHLHRGIQALGFAMGTISLGLGFKLMGGQWTAEDHAHAVHRNLGVAATVLACTQLTALVFRPQKGAKYRFAWEQWHHWVGRSAAVLAIANIYYGILHMWDLGAWAWASYTAVLSCIVAVAVVKDTADWMRARKLRRTKMEGARVKVEPSQDLSSAPGFGGDNRVTAAPFSNAYVEV